MAIVDENVVAAPEAEKSNGGASSVEGLVADRTPSPSFSGVLDSLRQQYLHFHSGAQVFLGQCAETARSIVFPTVEESPEQKIAGLRKEAAWKPELLHSQEAARTALLLASDVVIHTLVGHLPQRLQSGGTGSAAEALPECILSFTNSEARLNLHRPTNIPAVIQIPKHPDPAILTAYIGELEQSTAVSELQLRGAYKSLRESVAALGDILTSAERREIALALLDPKLLEQVHTEIQKPREDASTWDIGWATLPVALVAEAGVTLWPAGTAELKECKLISARERSALENVK